MRMDNWMEHEKEAYRQLNDYRLSELYSSNDIGEDPELRENFLLKYFEMNKKNYRDIIGYKVNNLDIFFNSICLNFLEGLVLYEIDGREKIENAINN
ncbi:MAG TPA: hypothetical protein QGG70_02515 [Candidatus Pacearchaeota archaeon]|jgi:hypothetical protein|nr:hypothetical protein [Candidatus Pacearchaeota archaeon]|tara:strand:- start:2 stop:292 length:291 start_codon:yes stop_codon:yes gene_type:complete